MADSSEEVAPTEAGVVTMGVATTGPVVLRTDVLHEGEDGLSKAVYVEGSGECPKVRVAEHFAFCLAGKRDASQAVRIAPSRGAVLTLFALPLALPHRLATR